MLHYFGYFISVQAEIIIWGTLTLLSGGEAVEGSEGIRPCYCWMCFTFVNSPNRDRVLRNIPWAFSLRFEMVNRSYGRKGVAQEQQSFVVFMFMMTNVLRSGLDTPIYRKIRGAKPIFFNGTKSSKC